jgi:hypothetical protein
MLKGHTISARDSLLKGRGKRAEEKNAEMVTKYTRGAKRP